MFCIFCGQKIIDQARFCPCCGQAVTRTDAVPEQQEPISDSVQDAAACTPPPTQEKKNPAAAEKKVRRSGYTKLGIAFIIIGLACGILGGILSSALADSYKGLSYTSGYSIGGQFVPTNSGTVGGNSQAVQFYHNMTIFMCVGGGFILLMGIAYCCIGRAQNSKPIQKRRGKIIDMDGFGVELILEFEDGTRMKVFNQSRLIFAVADQGVFELKGNRIVGFERNPQ